MHAGIAESDPNELDVARKRIPICFINGGSLDQPRYGSYAMCSDWHQMPAIDRMWRNWPLGQLLPNWTKRVRNEFRKYSTHYDNSNEYLPKSIS